MRRRFADGKAAMADSRFTLSLNGEILPAAKRWMRLQLKQACFARTALSGLSRISFSLIEGYTSVIMYLDSQSRLAAFASTTIKDI